MVENNWAFLIGSTAPCVKENMAYGRRRCWHLIFAFFGLEKDAILILLTNTKHGPSPIPSSKCTTCMLHNME